LLDDFRGRRPIEPQTFLSTTNSCVNPALKRLFLTGKDLRVVCVEMWIGIKARLQCIPAGPPRSREVLDEASDDRCWQPIRVPPSVQFLAAIEVDE